MGPDESELDEYRVVHRAPDGAERELLRTGQQTDAEATAASWALYLWRRAWAGEVLVLAAAGAVLRAFPVTDAP